MKRRNFLGGLLALPFVKMFKWRGDGVVVESVKGRSPKNS